MTPFEVNRTLLNQITDQQHTHYDRYTVKFVGSHGNMAYAREVTGTICDVLCYILPTDIILEVSRA